MSGTREKDSLPLFHVVSWNNVTDGIYRPHIAAAVVSRPSQVVHHQNQSFDLPGVPETKLTLDLIRAREFDEEGGWFPEQGEVELLTSSIDDGKLFQQWIQENQFLKFTTVPGSGPTLLPLRPIDRIIALVKKARHDQENRR